MVRKQFIFILIALILNSCNSSFHLDKRRYMNGYHLCLITHINNNSVTKSKQSFSKPDNQFNNQLLSCIPLLNNIKNFNNESKEIDKKNKDNFVFKPVQQKTVAQKKTINTKNKFQIKKTLSYNAKIEDNTSISLGEIILALCLIGVTYKGVKRHQLSRILKISAWGKRNKKLALFTSAFSQISLYILGFILGVKLFENQFVFSNNALYLFIATFISGFILHPFRKKGILDLKHYFREKFAAFILIISTLGLSLGLGNHIALNNTNGVVQNQFIYQNIIKNNIENGTKKQHSIRVAIAKNDVDNPLETKEAKALRIFLFILTTVIVCLLAFGIAAISCVVACYGNEGMALLILFGGTGLLTVGTIFAMRGIYRIRSAEEKDLIMKKNSLKTP